MSYSPKTLADLRLQQIVRRPILVVAFLKHLLSMAFLIACTAVMLKASPGEEILASLYESKSLSPVVFVTFALLNALALLSMMRTPSKVVGPQVSLITPSLAHRVLHHDISLMSLQMIEASIQVLQAYRLSVVCVDLSTASLYAMIICVACLGIPWLFFSTHFFVKTTLVLFLNSFVSFVLAVGFSLAQFLPPLAYGIFGDTRQQYSLVWMTRELSLTRFLFPDSGIALLEKAVLFTSSLLNLRRLVNHVRIPRATVRIRDTTSMRQSFSETLQTFVRVRKSLNFRRKRAQQTFLFVQKLVGATILVNVVYIHTARPSCPHGCVLETAPWFASQCSCRFLRINCHDAAFNTTDLPTLLSPRTWGHDVFILQLVQCPLESGLDLALLSAFPSLLSLVLEFSNVSDWRFNGSPWPSSLLALELRYSGLSTLPEVFYDLPPRLQILTLRGNHLTHLPPDVLPHWSSLAMLLLSEAQLTSVPDGFYQLTHLERLDLSGNAFSTVPLNRSDALPLLTRLELSNNAITTFPDALLADRPALLVDLSNNPIAAVPVSATAAIARRSVLLDGTPYCATTHAPGCASVCAASCSNLHWGDNVCHVGCNDPANCISDGGDCATVAQLSMDGLFEAND
ncbi:hypothetical protein ACHHYP_09859 [Achlya hypogyna]|uniref:LNR domain-containing protein n=1 Tax=Achlya hypogyna TaxID=1202772 RepID=A0A1V9ZIM8_ACHHY|nr:hypothetical protein ACHHYP_09859 [Achlya hypogyna]